jgi:hypothetical protein
MKKAPCVVRWTLALAFLAASGCAVHLPPQPPPVPIVPVSFEANLITARQCEFRGIADGQDQARSQGANLVLAFTYDDESTASGMSGKAVSCPPEALSKILAMGQAAKGSVQ